jgi:ubiquinone/menaquinone biosynthesis C-methylase UbiE
MAEGPADARRTPRHGPSSFGMQDPALVFGALGLKPGDVFFDLGCGPGDYVLAAADIVGFRGAVYGMDKWDEVLRAMMAEAALRGIVNICPLLGDMRRGLPLRDESVDVCLMATVLHVLNLKRDGARIFGEVRRVLKSQGRLAVISFKKEDRPWGPPIEQRQAPEEVVAALAPQGFRRTSLLDLGLNFMIGFVPA